MTFNLFSLRKQLELADERDYTWEEIAEGAGLHANTVYNLAAHRSKRVDIATIEALYNYFREQGLSIGIEDLIVVKEGDEVTV